MNVIVLLIILTGGLFCLIRGLKTKKVEEGKQVGTLYMIMAACLFGFAFVAILVQVFKPTHSMARLVFVIQGFNCGVGFGIFLAMRILGHFKPSGSGRSGADTVEKPNDGSQ